MFSITSSPSMQPMTLLKIPEISHYSASVSFHSTSKVNGKFSRLQSTFHPEHRMICCIKKDDKRETKEFKKLCTKCGQVFYSPEKLKAHMPKSHPKESNGKEFCRYYADYFLNLKYYEIHKKECQYNPYYKEKVEDTKEEEDPRKWPIWATKKVEHTVNRVLGHLERDIVDFENRKKKIVEKVWKEVEEEEANKKKKSEGK